MIKRMSTIPTWARRLLPLYTKRRLPSSRLVRRLTGESLHRMTVGVGQGLYFDPGPSNRAYATGNNEVPVQSALAKYLRPGAVFYDVGANVGFFTTIGARLVGANGRVYAFEPVPENAAYVRINVRLNHFRNVEVIEKAVSAASGRGDFWQADYSGGGALTSTPPPRDVRGTIPVEVVSLDQAVFSGTYAHPSLVKIDVEGAELPVLQGMSRLLRESRPIVLCELDDETADGLSRKSQAAGAYLEECGYHVKFLAESYPGINWHVSHFVAHPNEAVDGA